MTQPTFWSVFKAALPKAAGFYQRALPDCFRGLHEGLKVFRRLSTEGRVGAAFLGLLLTPPVHFFRRLAHLWKR